MSQLPALDAIARPAVPATGKAGTARAADSGAETAPQADRDPARGASFAAILRQDGTPSPPPADVPDATEAETRAAPDAPTEGESVPLPTATGTTTQEHLAPIVPVPGSTLREGHKDRATPHPAMEGPRSTTAAPLETATREGRGAPSASSDMRATQTAERGRTAAPILLQGQPAQRVLSNGAPASSAHASAPATAPVPVAHPGSDLKEGMPQPPRAGQIGAALPPATAPALPPQQVTPGKISSSDGMGDVPRAPGRAGAKAAPGPFPQSVADSMAQSHATRPATGRAESSLAALLAAADQGDNRRVEVKLDRALRRAEALQVAASQTAPSGLATAPTAPAIAPLTFEDAKRANIEAEIVVTTADAPRSDRAEQTQPALQRTATAPSPTAAGIGAQMAQAARQVAPGQIELRLYPEELGRLRLSFDVSEQNMVVTIFAERAETTDLMRRHVEQLAREMQSLGYKEVSFRFDGDPASTGTGTGDGNRDTPASGAAPHETVETTHAAPEALPAAAGAGLDLRI